MKRYHLLEKLDSAWTDFEESYAGLTPAQLMIPKVTGQWSVRDIIAHVTWWEQEALKSLPVIRSGGPVSYTHLRAHETGRNLVCRLLLEKKKKKQTKKA